eukprot:7388611-Prymnesium_polylepis.1
MMPHNRPCEFSHRHTATASPPPLDPSSLMHLAFCSRPHPSRPAADNAATSEAAHASKRPPPCSAATRPLGGSSWASRRRTRRTFA